jgi:nucleotide-binding universal stress UspA family protein
MNADLVVIGSRGLGATLGAMIGSTGRNPPAALGG